MHIILGLCSFLFFFNEITVRMKSISRNGINSRCDFSRCDGTRSAPRARQNRNEERESGAVCGVVREQGLQEHKSCCLVAYYNRTDSHRSITPSLYLYHEQRTVLKRRVLRRRSVGQLVGFLHFADSPPLRERDNATVFGSNPKGRSLFLSLSSGLQK